MEGVLRALEYDPIIKVQRNFRFDHTDETFVIESRQDCTAVVEANKDALRDDTGNWKGEKFHRVASIPLTVYMELQRNGIADDEKALRRWLDDRDNAVFRTKAGRLSK